MSVARQLELLSNLFASWPKGTPWRFSREGMPYYADNWLVITFSFDNAYSEWNVRNVNAVEKNIGRGSMKIEKGTVFPDPAAVCKKLNEWWDSLEEPASDATKRADNHKLVVIEKGEDVRQQIVALTERKRKLATGSKTVSLKSLWGAK